MPSRSIAPIRLTCYIPGPPALPPNILRAIKAGLAFGIDFEQLHSRMTPRSKPQERKAHSMNTKQLQKLGLLVVFLMSSLWPTVTQGTHRAQIIVDDDKAQCPNAGFTHIQDAVNAAAPGDTIRICSGIYVEQVVIRKSLDVNADNGAILMPAGMLANTTSLFDAAPIATALLVADTTSVSISGLTVDGANNGVSQCAPDLMGISFQNASGELDHIAVRNFTLGASLDGCQSGTGIFVQSGGGGVSKVEIDHCTVHDFQKNGITADEVGTVSFIRHNVVTGAGATNGAAQNGVQIGFGAGGSIVDNIVTNNVWAPCTAVST